MSKILKRPNKFITFMFVLVCLPLIFVLCYLHFVTKVSRVTRVPKYAANWSGLKVGMSKQEVIDLLGISPSRSEPIKFQRSPGESPLDTIVGTVIAGWLLDGWYERWHYGEFEMFENLLVPSEEAFVVYFDSKGRVVRYRRPLTGRFAAGF